MRRTSRPRCMEPRSSPSTGPGVPKSRTARCGRPQAYSRDGCHTARGDGSGIRASAGPGSTPRRGDGRRTTTAAGSSCGATGDGRRGPSSSVPSTRRHSSCSSAARSPSPHAPCAGRRSAGASPAFPGGGVRASSASLRAEGLSAQREATTSAASPRIVPAPKRTVAVAPPEGQSTGQRPPRPADTPNARRPDPGSAPNTAPGAPRSGARNAPAQPDSRQSKPPSSDEGDAGRKLNPPPPPPHNSADGRQARPHGGAGDKGRRPEAKHGQPQQKPPEGKEKPAEK